MITGHDLDVILTYANKRFEELEERIAVLMERLAVVEGNGQQAGGREHDKR